MNEWMDGLFVRLRCVLACWLVYTPTVTVFLRLDSTRQRIKIKIGSGS